MERSDGREIGRMALERTPSVTLRIVLLGDPHLVVDGAVVPFVAPPRTLPLLAFLALARAPVARDRLAAALWPDADDESARANLRRHLYRLQRALPAGHGAYVTTAGTTLCWAAPADAQIDVICFEEAIAAKCWTAAVEAYHGDLLPGAADEWLVPERERLRERFVRAALTATDQAQHASDQRSVETMARRLLEIDPWSEEAIRRLMSARYELGDRAGAFAEYAAFRERLRTELGTAPSAQTEAFAEMIRSVRTPTFDVKETTALTASARRLPFAGRDAEMAEIVDRWTTAVQSAGATLVVRGEPGIGKSRLAAEAAILVAAQGGRVLTGGTAAREARPYQAIVEALRSALPALVAAGDGATFLAPLASLIPDIAVQRAIGRIPALLDAGRERTRLFDAVVAAFAHLAHARPLLLILEDVHWAGSATIDLIEMLARRAPGIALLAIVTMRSGEPGSASRRLRELEADGIASAVPLGRLSRQATRTILEQTEAAAGDRADELYALSDGNPLFLAEAVRDSGERPARATAPASIADTIEARLARLADGPRSTLDVAAVCGGGFDIDAVCETGGWSEDRVAADLDTLVDLGIVRLSTARDRTRFTFAHDLIRSTAYDTIAVDRRRDLHRRIARVFAARAADRDEFAAPVAAHFDAAGLPDEAGTFYLRAARHAASVYANADVLALTRRALQLAGGDRLRFELYGLEEEAARRVGAPDVRLAASAAMLALAEQLDARAALDAVGRRLAAVRATGARSEIAELEARLETLDPVTATIERARSALLEANSNAALAATQRALDVALTSGGAAAAARAYVLRAQALAVAGRIVELEPVLNAAVETARRSADVALLQEVLHGAGIASFNANLLRRIDAYSDELLRTAQRAGDAEGTAEALMRRGSFRLRQQNFGAALPDLEAAAAEFTRIGHTQRAAEVSVNAAVLYAQIGDWEHGLRASVAASEMLARLGDVRRRATAAYNVASILLELGRYDEAEVAAHAAVEIARDAQTEVIEANDYCLLGVIARERGDLERAVEYIGRCVDMERRLPHAYEPANSIAELLVALVQAGRLAAAAPLADELAALPRERIELLTYPQIVPYARACWFAAAGDPTAAAVELDAADAIRRQRRERLSLPEWRDAYDRNTVNRKILSAAATASALTR